ncbi:MAG: hypothetical protein HPY44_13550 [Armatimonadetes bacterium]|nr:hypothetical protein [Armatimonadota bacterium]
MSTLARDNPLTPADVVREGLRRMSLRARFLLGARGVQIACAFIAAPLAAWVLWLRLHDVQPAPGGLWPALVPVAAAGLIALLWPLPEKRVARTLDHRLGLRDRISTAADLLARPEVSGMERAAIADASQAISRLEPAEALPLRLSRAGKVGAWSLVALALALYLPIPPLLTAAGEREDKTALREHAKLMKPRAKELEKAAREAKDEDAFELARRLKKLAKELDRGSLPRKQALLKMRDLEKDLEKYARQIQPPAMKPASKAGEELTGKTAEDMARQAEKLAAQARGAGKLDQAKELERLADEAREADSPEKLAKAAKALRQAAQRMGQQIPVSPETAAALAKAMTNEDMQEAMEKLSELAKQSGQKMQKMSKKDLEEMAKQLEKLAEALKDTNLDELGKALSEAVEKMKAGDREGAQKALEKAEKACSSGRLKLRMAQMAKDGAG